MRASNPLYDVLKANRRRFNSTEIVGLFARVSDERVRTLAASLADYISTNLPAAIEKRDGIADYRTNPYVLMTCASVMHLGDPAAFATFLFNSKMYMGLETSFGKSVEAALVGPYPIDSDEKWRDPPEKLAEFATLKGLSREEKARRRTRSVWREIDKSVIVGDCRYMTSIKSGPNTINDTQVQAMTQSIIDHHPAWLKQTRANHPTVTRLDVVLGLTYGTDRTTNNKENQVLVKLLEHGFAEEDRENHPGVLIDQATRSVRVYRRIGQDFWAFVGNPQDSSSTPFIFLEILLGLAKALSAGLQAADLEDRINKKIRDLAAALTKLQFPRKSLPGWVREDFSDDELFWFATAMTAFYDEGI